LLVVFAGFLLNPRMFFGYSGIDSRVLLLRASDAPAHNSDLYSIVVYEWSARVALA
jgi:hypothetical protein